MTLLDTPDYVQEPLDHVQDQVKLVQDPAELVQDPIEHVQDPLNSVQGGSIVRRVSIGRGDRALIVDKFHNCQVTPSPTIQERHEIPSPLKRVLKI